MVSPATTAKPQVKRVYVTFRDADAPTGSQTRTLYNVTLEEAMRQCLGEEPKTEAANAPVQPRRTSPRRQVKQRR